MTDAFSIDWTYVEGVPPATDPAVTATFAELSIRVRGETITRHQSRGALRERVFVPLAPIACWALRSWPDLFSERAPHVLAALATPHEALARAWADLDDASDDESVELERELEAWERSHALRMVGDGLLLPDLLLRRTPLGIEASWRSWRPSEHMELIESGSAVLSVADVAAQLRELVGSVRERLANVPRSSSLATWIDELAPRARAELTLEHVELLAERLGEPVEWVRGWASAEPDLRGAVVRDYAVPVELSYDVVQVDSPVASAFRSASGRLGDEDRALLKEHGRAVAQQAPAEGLAELRQAVLDEAARGWGGVQRAYRRAERVRARLAHRGLLDPSGRVDVERVLRELGVVVEAVELADPRTDGVALWSGERAKVLVNESSPRASKPWGRRALLAHELYHLLFDVRARAVFGEATGDVVQLPSEPLANAFAAELLAPKRELPAFEAKLWTRPEEAAAVVANVCDRFEVGRELALRQLQNRRDWPEPLVASLLNEAA